MSALTEVIVESLKSGGTDISTLYKTYYHAKKQVNGPKYNIRASCESLKKKGTILHNESSGKYHLNTQLL
jgi:hypothetical protein